MKNTKGHMYVFVLKRGIDPIAYSQNWSELAKRRRISLKANFVFVSEEFKEVRKLNPDELRVMGEMCFSDQAQKIGVHKED